MNRRVLPKTESVIPVNASIEGGEQPNDRLTDFVIFPVVLCLVCGLFAGIFTIGILLRRIAVAIAITGPLLFSVIWILRVWDRFRNKQLALGAFAIVSP